MKKSNKQTKNKSLLIITSGILILGTLIFGINALPDSNENAQTEQKTSAAVTAQKTPEELEKDAQKNKELESKKLKDIIREATNRASAESVEKQADTTVNPKETKKIFNYSVDKKIEYISKLDLKIQRKIQKVEENAHVLAYKVDRKSKKITQEKKTLFDAINSDLHPTLKNKDEKPYLKLLFNANYVVYYGKEAHITPQFSELSAIAAGFDEALYTYANDKTNKNDTQRITTNELFKMFDIKIETLREQVKEFDKKYPKFPESNESTK